MTPAGVRARQGIRPTVSYKYLGFGKASIMRPWGLKSPREKSGITLYHSLGPSYFKYTSSVGPKWCSPVRYNLPPSHRK